MNSNEEIKWYSPKEYPFMLSGFAWFSEDMVYRRLPLNPKFEIPKRVDELADNTAGGQIRFKTNSKKIDISVRLKSSADMYHMPATGQCGFDCYIQKDEKLLYCSTARFDHKKAEYECTMLNIKDSYMKGVVFNFPLYQGVEEVRIGLDFDAEVFLPDAYSSLKRIAFYGTSIDQGGCASRPGMLYSNILSRKLNMECINLGFSGSGRGEPEVAEIITEIENLGCIVIDYEANAYAGVKDTLENFIKILRKVHFNVPIVVLSKTKYASENFNEALLQDRLELLEFQRSIVDKARNYGDSNIYFVDGSLLLGDNWEECTVDGTHPTDLGFWKIADNLEPILRKLIF